MLALEKNAVATAGKQRIWRDRGDRARSAGNLEEAMRAYGEASLDEQVHSVRQELRSTGLAGVLQQLYALEGAGQYAAAVEVIRGVGDTFAGLRDWGPDLARLERAEWMAAAHRQAAGALRSGDRKAAMELLAKVIAVDPEYKDAAALLLEATTGVQVDAMRANLEAERAARLEAEAQRDRARRGRTLLLWGLGVIPTAAFAAFVGVATLRPGWLGQPSTPDAPTTQEDAAEPKPDAVPTAATEAREALTVVPATATTAGACPEGMAWIPGGKFEMGSKDFINQKPHSVTVVGFCMDLTEVTVAAYSSCVDEKACTDAGTGRYCNSGRRDRQDHSVNCVTWHQADTYCKAQRKRLPTEEEWEFAARGGEEQRLYPWGKDRPTNQLCWDGDGSDLGKGYRQSTCPVGKNPKGDARWGHHDLAGNVWEWTASHYCPYESINCTTTAYVLRGGGWNSDVASFVSALYRFRSDPSSPDDNFGFRCARTPQQ